MKSIKKILKTKLITDPYNSESEVSKHHCKVLNPSPSLEIRLGQITLYKLGRVS